MTDDEPARARPDIGDIFQPLPQEPQLDRPNAVAARAAVVAPALVLLGCASVFLPVSGSSAILLALAVLALAPAALSLSWLPGGEPRRARTATAITAALVGLAIGWLGLQANPCAADPIVTGLIGAGMGVGTVLIATSIGRALAMGGRMIVAVLVAGVVALLGFFLTAGFVLPAVFVLC
jgi:hypothetical protein